MTKTSSSAAATKEPKNKTKTVEKKISATSKRKSTATTKVISGGAKLKKSDAAKKTTKTVNAKNIKAKASKPSNGKVTSTTTSGEAYVSRKKQNRPGKVFLLKVSLNKTIFRVLALRGTDSLYKFAETITSAFNFNFDHSFGFYNNIKNIHGSNESDEVYTSFYDCGTPVTSFEKSVRKTRIEMAFELKKKMIFLFDYGDEWNFLVECCGIIEAEVGKRYPKITKMQGEAPPQYEIDSDDEEYDEE